MHQAKASPHFVSVHMVKPTRFCQIDPHSPSKQGCILSNIELGWHQHLFYAFCITDSFKRTMASQRPAGPAPHQGMRTQMAGGRWDLSVNGPLGNTTSNAAQQAVSNGCSSKNQAEQRLQNVDKLLAQHSQLLMPLAPANKSIILKYHPQTTAERKHIPLSPSALWDARPLRGKTSWAA